MPRVYRQLHAVRAPSLPTPNLIDKPLHLVRAISQLRDRLGAALENRRATVHHEPGPAHDTGPCLSH